MKIILIFLAVCAVASCGSPSATNNSAAPQAGTAITSSPSPVTKPTPIPTASVPPNGDYPARGVVTKINLELGSVELEHEEIKGVMPAMKMEFYVTDRKQLDSLKVGDKANFTLRYWNNTEKISNIKKAE